MIFVQLFKDPKLIFIQRIN